jgi:hypothetical protein
MLLIVAALASLYFYSTAQAVETANTLKVAPVRTDVSIKPGETKTVKTTVSNLTDDAIKVRPIQNDFIAGDERGTPSLILDADKYAPSHSLKRFMKPLSDVTIPAHDAKTINVVISVPKDAQPGGYFGAIRFAPTNPDDGGQVNLSASVASIILVTVPGDTVEKLTLTDFEVQQNGASNWFFANPEGIQATVRFENKGNIQVGPFGKVSVKQGDKVVYEKNFNEKVPRDMILPDSARRWDIPLDKIEGFGHYTVNATFTYGSKNQTIEVEKSFWVIPIMMIVLGVVGLLVLIGIIVGIWFFLRGYKRRILRKHGGGGSGLRHL